MATFERVQDPSAFPYSAIVDIAVTYEDGSRVRGTGAVIGPNDVLTASHVVDDEPGRGEITSIVVTPGRDGADAPFGEYEAAERVFFQIDEDGDGAIGLRETRRDYALLTVEDPEPIGLRTGWFGYGFVPLAPGETIELETAGYPAGLQDGGPVEMYRAVDEERFNGAVLVHDNEQESGVDLSGSSGAPLWIMTDDGPLIVGINSTSSTATYITSAVFEDIEGWVESNGDGSASETGPAPSDPQPEADDDASASTAPTEPEPDAGADASEPATPSEPGPEADTDAPEPAAPAATNGDDTIEGDASDEEIAGLGGDDSIVTREGDDVVSGGAGDDTIKSGAGSDRVRGDDGEDVILSGDGDDVVRGGDGADDIKPGHGDDTVFGEAGDDVVAGFRGDERLEGGSGNDRLLGSVDDDTLVGGAGDDRLHGGPGFDVFVFEQRDFGDDRLPLDVRVGSDVLDFTAIDGLSREDFTITQVGANVVLEVADGGTLVMNGDRFGGLFAEDVEANFDDFVLL